MLTTTRRAISYPNPDRSDRADIALHIGNIALAADSDVIFNQGTDAQRQAAAHQAGGGRFWWATDTSLLWYDDGATWRSVAPTTSNVGLLSARPAANAIAAGSTYFATDQVSGFITDGSSWIRTSLPAGATMEWYKPDAAVPPGWVLYDGGNLPAATGIYADLYAHLGNTLTKPDTSGRQAVSIGPHGDVSAIGVNDGLPASQRTPRHNSSNTLGLPNHVHPATDSGHGHGYTDPGHYHIPYAGASTYVTKYPPGDGRAPYQLGGASGNLFADLPQTERANIGITISNGVASITVGNPSSLPAITGSIGPGGSRPVDTGAFIVCARIGKL